MTRAVVGIFCAALALTFITYAVWWSVSDRPESALRAVLIALCSMLGAITTLRRDGMRTRGGR